MIKVFYLFCSRLVSIIMSHYIICFPSRGGTKICLVGEDCSGWGRLTLFFIFLPFIMSCLVWIIHRVIGRSPTKKQIHSSSKTSESRKHYEFWENLGPIKHLPILQTAGHVSTLKKLTQIANEIDNYKKLLKDFHQKSSGIEMSQRMSVIEFQRIMNNDLIEYSEYVAVGDFRANERKQAIMNIPGKIEKNLKASENELSVLLCTFKTTKLFESFFESAPQFTLQLYILLWKVAHLDGALPDDFWTTLMTIGTRYSHSSYYTIYTVQWKFSNFFCHSDFT